MRLISGLTIVTWLLVLQASMGMSASAQSVDVAATPQDRPGLPPVEDFLRLAEYSLVTLSPDGKLLAALVPLNGHRNLALIDIDRGKAIALTTLRDEDVSSYEWIGDRLLEFRTANLGDALSLVRTRRRILIDTEGHVVRDLMRAAFRANHTVDAIVGGGGVLFEVLDSIGRSGEDLVVVTNERNRYGLDAYRYNPRTMEKTLLTFRSPGDVTRFIADRAGQIRIAQTAPRGGEKTAWWYRRTNDDEWTKMAESDVEQERVVPLAFDFDDKTLYVRALSSAKGGRSGVYTYDLEKGELGPLVYESPIGEVGGVRFDRVKQKVVGFEDTSTIGIKWIDPDWERLQKSIDGALPGMRNRLGWAAYDTDRVIVTSDSGSESPTFYLLDRKTHKMEPVAVARSALKSVELGSRRFVRYDARDGLSIPAYLTLPHDGPKKNLPLVVIIHGGPYVNATRYGFDPEAHLFASRGYAVLQPDFRGTRGYGDSFYKAGWKQWGLAMQDDVTDGVKWLIANGTVDKDRVCLFGGSYGGYATLWGLEKEPRMFRCGVAFVAVSDLEMMFDVAWSDVMRAERNGDSTRTLTRWIGDPDKDRDKMRAVSPLYHVDRIQAPLLLAYGAADQRVPLIHGNRMRSALDRYDKKYDWVVYNDEAHGFNKDENKFDFYRRVDAFLAKNLAPRAP
ncbi:MAG: S9 family peptidase [Burkholderiaceae bacterium]